MKFQAAVLVAQQRPLEIVELSVPPLEVGQVLVKVLATTICGSQLGEIEGVKGPDPYLPHLLGHEGFGQVLEIGPGVSKVQPNQNVVLHWRKNLGIDARPASYQHPDLGLVRSGAVTTFSTMTIVAENRLTPVPAQTPPETACLLGCAVTTGFGLLQREAKLEMGQSLLVLGVGGVGLSVVAAGQLRGGTPIACLDRFESRLALAKRLGADVLCNSSEQLAQWHSEHCPGGFDVVVENTGLPSLIELGYSLTAPKGRLVLVGVPKKGQCSSLYTLPLHFGKTVIGTEGGQSNPAVDIPNYLRLQQSGKFDFAQLCTDRYVWPEINRAIDEVRQGLVAGRALVEMKTL